MSLLDDYKQKLNQDIAENLDLIKVANSLIGPVGVGPGLNSRQAEQITESAFANVHAGWEIFIENCFLNYMVGLQTASGYKPTRYVLPKDLEHANKLVSSGRDFFPWGKPKTVWEQAEYCFVDGEPFRTALESASTDLIEMTVIRNEISHRSKTSNEKFRSFVRGKLKTAPPDITPGQFLVTTRPKTIGTTFISYYSKKLKITADKIVPS
jgi:hypothetical protein